MILTGISSGTIDLLFLTCICVLRPGGQLNGEAHPSGLGEDSTCPLGLTSTHC